MVEKGVVQIAPGLYASISKFDTKLDMPTTYVERVIADDPTLKYYLIKYYKSTSVAPVAQAVGGPGQVQVDISAEVVGRLVGQAQVYIGSGVALVLENYVYDVVPDAVKILGIVFDWLERFLKNMGVERVFISAEEPEYEQEFWIGYLEARGYKPVSLDKSYYHKDLQ